MVYSAVLSPSPMVFYIYRTHKYSIAMEGVFKTLRVSSKMRVDVSYFKSYFVITLQICLIFCNDPNIIGQAQLKLADTLKKISEAAGNGNRF